MIFAIILLGYDFAISADTDDQNFSTTHHACDQYYVFWEDLRFYPPDRSIFGARVTSSGTLVDSLGRLIFRNRAVVADAAYDGTQFFVAVQDSC